MISRRHFLRESSLIALAPMIPAFLHQTTQTRICPDQVEMRGSVNGRGSVRSPALSRIRW